MTFSPSNFKNIGVFFFPFISDIKKLMEKTLITCDINI